MTTPADSLSATFAALADPTRRAILARLASGEASVTELARPFDMSMPAISKHLKVLERAGVIARGRDAQWRPCRLAARPLKDVADWVGNYRRFWEESFNRLDDYLDELKKAGKQKAEPQNAEMKSAQTTSAPTVRAQKKAAQKKPVPTNSKEKNDARNHPKQPR